MTAKQWLLRCVKQADNVDSLAERLQEQYDKATSTTHSYDALSIDRTHDISRRFDNLAIIKEQYDDAVAELFSIMAEFIEFSRFITENDKACFFMARYVNRESYESIATKLGVTTHTLYRWQKEIHKLIEETVLSADNHNS